MARISGGILLALLLGAAPVAAQYGSYYVPGSLAESQRRSRDAVLQELQDARWSIGPLRIDPRLSVGNLGYIDNVYNSREEDAQSDLRASADAGLRAFVHLGPKVVATGFANAGYSWWREQTDLRALNGSYGVQIFGLFNRLQFEIEAGRVETQRNLSSEVEAPVDVRSDRVAANLDIDVRGPLSFFLAASTAESRFSGEAAQQRIPDLALNTLDRTTEVVSVGILYELGSGLSLGLGVERTEADFEDDPGGRSNEAFGPLLRVELDGNRLSLSLNAALKDLEFTGREAADDRRQLTGIGQLAWQFTDRLSASFYSATQLSFAALETDSVFEGSRSGVRIQRRLGRRLSGGVFYEFGEDEFAGVGDDRVTRVDEFTSFGISFEMTLTPRTTVAMGFLDTRRDSSDPQFDRAQSSATLRINVGGNLLPW